MTAPLPGARGLRPSGSIGSAALPLGDGRAARTTLVAYGANRHDPEVLALVHREHEAVGDLATVRLHSACFTGDVLGSVRCDCGAQLSASIQAIVEAPFGVLLYFLNHEGRGIGLLNKLRAYGLQDQGLDTVEANLALGLPADQRDFGIAAAVLGDLGVQRVRLLSNNPRKVQALREGRLNVVEVRPLEIPSTAYNAEYLEVKRRLLHAACEEPTQACGAAPRADPETGGQRFQRHRGPVASVASVPRSGLVLSGAYDGAVALFDTARQEARLLGYHDHLVNSVSVDESGRLGASCSSDYTIRIWDLTQRRLHRTLLGHADDVEAFVFLDGGRGASASRDRRILIWNLDTGAILRVLEGHEKDVLSLAYRDGILLSSGDDHTLRLWNVETGRMQAKWGPFELETDTCAIDPVHGRLVLGCDDGRIRAYSIETGNLTHDIEAHRSGIKRVAVSPTSGRVVTAAYDQRVRVWGGPDLRWRFDLEGAPPWERSLAWSHDGESLLAGTFDGTLRCWEGRTGRFVAELGESGDEAGNACFNDLAAAGTGRAAVVSDDGRLRTLRHDAELAWEHRGTPARGRILMNAVGMDSRGELVAGGAHDHRLHVWRCESAGLRELLDRPLGEGPINMVRFWEREGRAPEVLACCYSGAVVGVALDGSVERVLRCHDGAVKALRLARERGLGLSGAADGSACAWDLEGRIHTRFFGHSAIINDLDLAPDADRVASVSRDFTLKVHEVGSGRLVESVELGRRSLKCVSFFSADTLFVGDYWGHLIRVDLGGPRVTRHRIARNGISAVKRAGDSLLACSYDGAVYRVDPATLAAAETLQAMEQRPEPASFERSAP